MKRKQTATKWASVASLAMVTACIGPFPDGPDETAGEDGAFSGSDTEPTESGAQTMTGPHSDSSEATGPIDPSQTTDPGYPSDSGHTSDPGHSSGPSPTDPHTTGPSDTDPCPGGCESDTTSGAEPSVCGVEVVHDYDWNTQYICACEACEVEFNYVAPEVGDALLEECSCICDAVGCGGSVSGGATSEVSDETGDDDEGGGEGPTSEDDGPSDDDGPDTEPTG